ncbi:MAG: T9SS type A sorting domain-containing protein [Flavobacteriaceae bacterium]|nr:T9SS type A sorting domain-containing protein [Flavobacteriaceae bacterium]
MKKIYLFTSIMMLLIGFTSNAQVVISQVYGGGGNTGAQYLNDFVELFNRGTVAADISGWSVQYASATGPSTSPFLWAVNSIPAATTIAPGKYFLIKLSGGTTSGIALPTPDLDVTTSPLALSGTTGKVALVNSATALSGATLTTGTYIDLVGFGPTVTAFEGTAAVAVLSNTTAAIRINGGCTDNNSNSTDFTVGAPTPKNSATAANICSTSPSVTITSPVNATIYNPLTTSVTVNVSVSNFTVANGTGTGHIHYTVDGGATIMKYDTTPIVLTGLSVGSHTVVVSLVDNAHAPLSPSVSTTSQFTIAALTNVSAITILRAGTLNAYYTLNGTVVVSHVRSPAGTVSVSTTRNQKFIQDSTGGILIDDSAGKITTIFAAGDSMNNVSGQLTDFNGMLQFVPLQNQTVVSSGNTLTPQNITIAALNANVNTYESKLISFSNITITGTIASGSTTVTPLTAGQVFTTSTNYNVFDGTTNGVLRTGFAEANYIGTVVPTVAFSATALGYDNVTTATPPVLTPQFIIRNNADITVLSIENNEIVGLKVYPNPVSNGILHIESNINTERTISLFDVLGKEVIKTTTSNTTINISNLNSGIYIVKITEGGKTATRKLVVK